MDDAAGALRKKSSVSDADFDRIAALQERLERSLREAAEIDVPLSRLDGTIRGTPHDSVIEGRAHEIGKRLGRTVQQRQMSELAAQQDATAKCPACGAPCDVTTTKRAVQSVDGMAELTESQGYCPGCRRAFFPAT